MLLPESWIDDLEERLSAYRSLAMCRTTAAVRDVLAKWEDLYGEPPEEVLNLGWAAEAKVRARALGISHIRWKQIRVDLDFDPSTPVSRDRLSSLCPAMVSVFRWPPCRAKIKRVVDVLCSLYPRRRTMALPFPTLGFPTV